MVKHDDEVYKILADHLAKGLETAQAIIMDLKTEINSLIVELAESQAELKSVKSDVDSLTKTVIMGNGEKSVVSRLIILESQMEQLEKNISSLSKKASKTDKAIQKIEDNIDEPEIDDELKDKDSEDKGKIKAALITGGLGLVATLVSAIISHYFK